ncbi:transmembrane protein [Legionella quinlivanii]|uniref:Ancillary SecYEG translocon subunit n=1 Tax=Legionella quinlivanii TaxID=45073 RepID=A0A0W0XTP1_9GAMM|nr:tetratricopeptide repeat protein [Legionella quinlivanii]KTD47946.1 transmembrane protein [Legionella quinlivanii]MCW8450774.1 tetratricopeptide repeat protein [Legionella quinlivanii]SEG19736.1 Putative negative regulator of RcsB-dependent stress response [Legionella quinlivanii DSM 21216]STY11056.1 transmembrane protein [Legionella quinlivanii]
MSVYMTEEEQLEAIKKWWNRYSTLITIVLSVILLAVSAYKYWNWHVEKVNMQASNAYEHMMVAYSNKDNKSIKSYANDLITNYSETVYADAARMILAKLLTAHNHFGKARTMLEGVASHSKMKALKQVARIRIARLLAAEKNYDKALEELTSVDDAAYMPVINELKGDIFAATGHYQQAITSYKEAITEVRTHGIGNLFLEMKTNELAALSQSSVTKSNLQAA